MTTSNLKNVVYSMNKTCPVVKLELIYICKLCSVSHHSYCGIWEMPPHLIKVLMPSVSTAYLCHFWCLNDRERGLEQSLCSRLEICRHLWERFPSTLHQQLPMVSIFFPRGELSRPSNGNSWKLEELCGIRIKKRKKKVCQFSHLHLYAQASLVVNWAKLLFYIL